jgi:hypothetical protein
MEDPAGDLGFSRRQRIDLDLAVRISRCEERAIWRKGESGDRSTVLVEYREGMRYQV